MTKGSYFLNVSINETKDGFSWTKTGNKIYSIEYFEEIERLIDTAYKYLKMDQATITPEWFDNGSESLIRAAKNFDGTIDIIRWKRNKSNYVVETTIENIALTKKAVKAFVLESLELFRDMEFRAAE